MRAWRFSRKAIIALVVAGLAFALVASFGFFYSSRMSKEPYKKFRPEGLAKEGLPEYSGVEHSEGLILGDSAAKAIAVLEKGGPEEAARSLVSLIPSAEAYIKYRNAIKIPLSVDRDDINVGVLQSAGPAYHSWHATKIIIGPTRSLAVLQWIAQKIWEAPSGRTKESAAACFIQDIEHLVATGKMDALQGASLARNSILDLENGIASGVPVTALLAFQKELVLNASRPNYRGGLTRQLIEMGRFVYLADIAAPSSSHREMEELYEFMQAEIPEYKGLSLREVFDPPYASKIPVISWHQYETLPLLSYEALGMAIEAQCYCEDVTWSIQCKLASQRLLDEFQSRPDDILALVKQPQILSRLTIPFLYLILERVDFSDVICRNDHLVVLFADELSIQAGTWDPRGWYRNDVLLADALLKRIFESKCTCSAIATIQKALGLSLINAAPLQERFSAGTGLWPDSPLRVLMDRLPNMDPAATLLLQESIVLMLDDPKVYAELKPSQKETFRRDLCRVLEEIRKQTKS